MEMKCEILGSVLELQGVVKVSVPSIYPIGDKGGPLPERLAKLVQPAAEALQKVYEDVVAAGGHLYISDMFRSAAEQQKAHEDFVMGRKSAFSPPSCSSVHEAGRAIDIDAFDTLIGHKRVREILNQRGWVNIVPALTGNECWHYEFREAKFEQLKQQQGYAAMARAMKTEIGNLVGAAQADAKKEEIKQLQQALNKLLGTSLVVDGMFGEKSREAVLEFQQKNGLQADGVPGPITRQKIKDLLG
jgi:murein L,D-transpeptidase YcbB/YkuD